MNCIDLDDFARCRVRRKLQLVCKYGGAERIRLAESSLDFLLDQLTIPTHKPKIIQHPRISAEHSFVVMDIYGVILNKFDSRGFKAVVAPADIKGRHLSSLEGIIHGLDRIFSMVRFSISNGVSARCIIRARDKSDYMAVIIPLDHEKAVAVVFALL